MDHLIHFTDEPGWPVGHCAWCPCRPTQDGVTFADHPEAGVAYPFWQEATVSARTLKALVPAA